MIILSLMLPSAWAMAVILLAGCMYCPQTQQFFVSKLGAAAELNANLISIRRDDEAGQAADAADVFYLLRSGDEAGQAPNADDVFYLLRRGDEAALGMGDDGHPFSWL